MTMKMHTFCGLQPNEQINIVLAVDASEKISLATSNDQSSSEGTYLGSIETFSTRKVERSHR